MYHISFLEYEVSDSQLRFRPGGAVRILYKYFYGHLIHRGCGRWWCFCGPTSCVVVCFVPIIVTSYDALTRMYEIACTRSFRCRCFSSSGYLHMIYLCIRSELYVSKSDLAMARFPVNEAGKLYCYLSIPYLAKIGNRNYERCLFLQVPHWHAAH